MAGNQIVQVLAATRDERVYELLRTRDDLRYEIALHTGTITDLLPQSQLVVIDYEDIIPYPLSEAELRERIFAARIHECSSQDFAANPDRYLRGLGSTLAGKILSVPENFCVAFVSYSGGTGRTTIALDTALHYRAVIKQYREKHKKEVQLKEQVPDTPPLLIEVAFGASSLAALTGLDMPQLYQLATDPDIPAMTLKDVTLVPMDYDHVRMLSRDLLERYLNRVMSKHSLTIIDSVWPTDLVRSFKDRVNLWVVVASERMDTIANARKLYTELVQEYGDERVWTLLNQTVQEKGKRKKSDQAEWDIRLPYVVRPDEYAGELGRGVLTRVFAPVWQDYENLR